MGVRKTTAGTVLANNIGHGNGRSIAVRFDEQEYDQVRKEIPWYSNAQEIVECPGRNVKIGDRVVLEYITSFSSGLWHARLPRPGENINDGTNDIRTGAETAA